MASHIQQTFRGIRVVNSAALTTELNPPSGGVATLLPLSYEVLNVHVIYPGRALATHCRVRTQEIWLVNLYVHANERRKILDAVISWVTETSNAVPFLLCGDFNQCDVYEPELWADLQECTGTEDVDPALLTFHSGDYHSPLDRCLFPSDATAGGDVTARLSTTNLFEHAGHSLIRADIRSAPKLPDICAFQPRCFAETL